MAKRRRLKHEKQKILRASLEEADLKTFRICGSRAKLEAIIYLVTNIISPENPLAVYQYLLRKTALYINEDKLFNVDGYYNREGCVGDVFDDDVTELIVDGIVRRAVKERTHVTKGGCETENSQKNTPVEDSLGDTLPVELPNVKPGGLSNSLVKKKD